METLSQFWLCDNFQFSEAMSTDDLDGFLVGLDSGLTIALQRAKVWSKYMLDIITYIEKKTQIGMLYFYLNGFHSFYDIIH